MRERLIAVLTVLAVIGLYAWYDWHPGGPMNRHVWMSEQIKSLPPPKPAPTTTEQWAATTWGINIVDTNPVNATAVPMEIDIRRGDKWVSVKLDVCMKHGEWRVLP